LTNNFGLLLRRLWNDIYGGMQGIELKAINLDIIGNIITQAPKIPSKIPSRFFGCP
jgi:hypothetical protein